LLRDYISAVLELRCAIAGFFYHFVVMFFEVAAAAAAAVKQSKKDRCTYHAFRSAKNVELVKVREKCLGYERCI
jgi:hypothetical protein